jgi:tetrahydromethanopterin S-methyltransferase subunit C
MRILGETSVTEQQTNGGIGGAARSIGERASAIVRLEIELAALELKKKATALAFGIGLGVGAVILVLLGVGFVFATIAAALATFLALWLALLVVTLGLFVLAGLLGVLALRKIKKGTPPLPEQAIQEAKLTAEAVKR